MIREKFVEKFGESETHRMEAAAEEHGNGINNGTIGDPFKWALLICIGYDCFTIPHAREHHGFVASVDELKQWIRENAELGTYQGDLDYLALACGAYDEYMPKKSEAAK